MELILIIATLVGGLAAVGYFLEKISPISLLGGLAAVGCLLEKISPMRWKPHKGGPPVTQNSLAPPSAQAEEPHDPAAGIDARPATVRIYTLGPHGSFGMLSWTTEYAKAIERWDAFWKSHSADQAGIVTRPADSLTRYRELHPYCSIGSQASGKSQSPETTSPIPEVTSEKRPDVLTRLLDRSNRPKNIEDLYMPGGLYEACRGVNTANFEGFDEQGVGFKDIHQDQLSDYCPPLPVIRRF
jgi:hypothetical protein